MSTTRGSYHRPEVTGDLEFETQAMWCRDEFGNGKTPSATALQGNQACGPVWLNKTGLGQASCYMNPDVRSS